MTANVKILIDQHPDVLKVPNAALRFHPAAAAVPRPAAGKGTVHKGGAAPMQALWVLDEKNEPKQVRVKTGETDGTFTEITEGSLKEGDRVIVAAMSKQGAPAAGSAFNTQSGGGRRGPGF
jgi:HlyD family secretion protein